MKTFVQAAVAFSTAFVMGNASAALILPPAGTLSVQYDDAFSYSTRVLDYFDPGAGWTDKAGTGNLGVIVTTRSSGQQNPTNFPDPVVNPNDSPGPINGDWGGTSTSTLLVSTLRDYLVATFNATIPLFSFDQNETGGNPDLLVTAKVEIIDGVGGSVLHTWALDNTLQAGDGNYDPTSKVTAPGTITIPDVLGTCPGNGPCTFENNVGSGQFDYIIFFPTMDLTPWADSNNLFKVTWSFDQVDDGGEEITIFGLANTSTPEPGSLALIGLAGLAMVLMRKRKFV